MEIRLPKEVIEYLDSIRGKQSRQAYIVSMLICKMQEKPKILPALK